MSGLQHGLLFHTLYAPESGLYFVQSVFEVHGVFDVVAFERAWQVVAERHPVLRTAVLWEGLRCLCRWCGVGSVCRWCLWTGGMGFFRRQAERLQSYLQAVGRRGSSCPRRRCCVWPVFGWPRRSIGSCGASIICCWMAGVRPRFCGKCSPSIRRFISGQDLQLAPARPYRDYIGWLAEQDLDAAERYWRQSLRGFEGPTAVVMDRPPADGAPLVADDFGEYRVLVDPRGRCGSGVAGSPAPSHP